MSKTKKRIVLLLELDVGCNNETEKDKESWEEYLMQGDTNWSEVEVKGIKIIKGKNDIEVRKF